MRVVFLILPFLFCCGCFTKYEPVYVPTKCEIEIPKRPKQIRGNAYNVKQIIEYSEKLEYNLKFCIYGEIK